MPTTVRSVLNRVAALLNDEEYERWEEAELIGWLNDGQKAIATAPATDAYVKRDNITTVAGTIQSLPADGIRLVEVVKNVTDGSPVLQSDYSIVDILGGAWRGGTAATLAENYFFDERNPKEFEVYPPAVGGDSIEIVYGANPDDVGVNDNITIDDEYADALINYVVYRSLSKDTEDASPELGRATAFYRAYLLATGQKDQVDVLVEPRRS
jgi:hypothetical protein